MMSRLSEANVPFLILSAGLGDLVTEICKSQDVMKSNVKVVSNFLAFDNLGNVTGIEGEMIHVFNKNESAIHDSEYFKRYELTKYFFSGKLEPAKNYHKGNMFSILLLIIIIRIWILVTSVEQIFHRYN